MPFISSVRGSFGAQSKSRRNGNKLMINGGNNVTVAGGYRIHEFTSTGSATFDTVNYGLPLNAEILMIAGGGGGGSIGGGGGAGGYIYGTINLNPNSYSLSVGNGGSRSPSGHGSSIVGTQGGNTTGFGLTAIGGGFGCGWESWIGNSGAGGSSGGGTGSTNAVGASQPSANGGSVPAGLTQIGHAGSPGGVNNDGPGNTGSPQHQGGGGGGAGGAGNGRPGGIGIYSSITGTSVGRGGGGGGGTHVSAANNPASSSFGSGGQPYGGGLGAGSNATGTYDGSPNTGSGGGGAYHTTDNPAGGGGSGVIIVRYTI